jgi:predicted ATPase/DNA-binding SARP family transcriptional activator
MPRENRGATEATALEIWLLGGFRVTSDSRSVAADEWRRKKVSGLVKLLALAGGRLHRDQFVDALWPDLAPEAAANNLYQTLHTARRLLGSIDASARSYLQIRSDIVQLVLDGDVWIDVIAFGKATKAARASNDVVDYRAALDLYAGDLLPEDVSEVWTKEPRATLRREYVALLLGLAQQEEARHQADAAIQSLQRAVEADPAHEEANARLMRWYASRGERQRAIRQYQSLVEHLREELGAPPDPRTERLHQGILAGHFPRIDSVQCRRTDAPLRKPHNLPNQLTRFIGRAHALAEVQRLLNQERLLTLIGPGGCGKTRLAIEAGQMFLDTAPDGVWFVDLAPLADPTQVPLVAAAVLGIQDVSNRTGVDSLVAYLQSRRLLLIVDNCEHLIEACAALINALLRSCPELRVLATSREPLGIAGEITWIVPSLSLANPKDRLTLDAVLRSEAAQLFVERAKAAKADFRVGEQNAAAIAQVCYRLDGIPLAIELAAARVAAFGVEQIARRIEDSFRLLTSGSRTGLARQQTLRATLDWSYELLPDAERTILRRLSVFAGGFTIEAAEFVCGSDDPELDALELLFRLINRSLVVAEDRDGFVRYRLLEMVRQYAEERLREYQEVEPIQRRHLSFFVALAETAEPHLTSAHRTPWLTRLSVEHDNLRAALTFSLTNGADAESGLRLAGALVWYWNLRRLFVEGRDWAERALKESGSQATPRARARALCTLGRLGLSQGDNNTASQALEECLSIARELADEVTAGAALAVLGVIAVDQGDPGRARPMLEESIAIYRRTKDSWSLGLSLYCLGDALAVDSPVLARATYSECLALFREQTDPFGMAYALTSLGRMALDEGNLADARASFEEALDIRRALGDRWLTAISLNSLAMVERQQGNWRRVAELADEALSLSRELGSQSKIAWSLFNLGVAASALGDNERALEYFGESLRLEAAAERRPGIARVLAGLAEVARHQGQHERAARLMGAVDGLLATKDQRLEPIDQAVYERSVAAIRDSLGAVRFEQAWKLGGNLAPNVAVAYALAPKDDADHDPRFQ